MSMGCGGLPVLNRASCVVTKCKMAAGVEVGTSSSFAQEIAVLTSVQLIITILSCLFANYLFTNVTFVSSSVYSFKIFSIVYLILALFLLLPRAKKRFTVRILTYLYR